MIQESSFDSPLDLQAAQIDDLTTIKGIALARQQWLRESFNVRFFRDLAALTVDEIESRLKEDGHIASRSEIERWIAEARELAKAAGALSEQVTEPEEQDAKQKPSSSIQPTPWRSFAAFVVEFQGRTSEDEHDERQIEVTHIPVNQHGTWLENDREKAVVKGEGLHQWMLERLGRGSWSGPEAGHHAAVGGSVAARRVNIEVSQIRAFQPPQAERPSAVGESGRPFLGFVRSEQPFALEASIRLTGPDVSEVVAEQLTCDAHFYAYDLSTGTTEHLGNAMTSPLANGLPSYAAILPRVLLEPGMYRVRVRALLEGLPAVRGYTEVPMLQVV